MTPHATHLIEMEIILLYAKPKSFLGQNQYCFGEVRSVNENIVIWLAYTEHFGKNLVCRVDNRYTQKVYWISLQDMVTMYRAIYGGPMIIIVQLP